MSGIFATHIKETTKSAGGRKTTLVDITWMAVTATVAVVILAIMFFAGATWAVGKLVDEPAKYERILQLMPDNPVEAGKELSR